MQPRSVIGTRLVDLRYLLTRDRPYAVHRYVVEGRPPYFRQRMAKDLGMTFHSIKRTLKVLQNHGAYYSVNVEYPRLGLLHLVFVLREPPKRASDGRIAGLRERSRWFMRWCSSAFFPEPRGFAISFVPISESAVEAVVGDYKEISDIERYFVADVFVPNNVDRSYVACEWSAAVCANDWARLARSLRSLARSLEGEMEGALERSQGEPPLKRARLDLLDLLLLSYLEENALYRPSELAGLVNASPAKVLKHVRKHLVETGVVRGARLRYGRSTVKGSVLFLAVGRDRPARAMALLGELARVYGFLNAFVNSLTGDFAFAIGVSVDEIEDYAEHVPKALREVFEEVEVYQLDKASIYSYTIPYVAYDRLRKEWSVTEPSIEATREALKKRGLL